MAPLKLSEREKNLLIITIGFVVFYVFYVFLLTPKWDEISKTKLEASNLRLNLRIAEGKIKILDAIEKSVGISPDVSILSRDEKALEVLKLLSQATVRSGLTLNFIKPNLDDQSVGLKFSLSCNGHYNNLYTFFSILYRLRILILVDSLEVLSTGGSNPDLGIKINLTAYY
jgi:Tfp pilus assembly protein PilO